MGHQTDAAVDAIRQHLGEKQLGQLTDAAVGAIRQHTGDQQVQRSVEDTDAVIQHPLDRATGAGPPAHAFHKWGGNSKTQSEREKDLEERVRMEADEAPRAQPGPPAHAFHKWGSTSKTQS